MTISIWRYSHLTLAISSSLFLIIASLTGIILAFAPMQSALKPYAPVNLPEVRLSETFEALETSYKEVLSLEVDADDFLIASVVTKNGDSETIYIHPKTGEKLGTPATQSALFQWTTNLHRSLFLKGIGRFFVGLISFLLCLIAVTGLLLIIKRQGGLTKLFSKVQKDYPELRYHVLLGRWFLVPIILVAATGVYLSAEQFSLLPKTSVTHEVIEPETKVDMTIRPSKLELFQNIKLSNVRKISFPFSEMSEDYFEVSLKDRELYVHQYTGQILSEAFYPFTTLANRWSLAIHTGQGSILWSLVLLLASISMLYFIYSGFVMWRKRMKGTKSDALQTEKDKASHIILVGSETGNTFQFANCLAKGLITAGKSVYVSELNKYSTYKKAEQLIILTATYGEGEATTNARNFEKLFKSIQPIHNLSYSVVGFGSLLYPDYCAFAITVNELLKKNNRFKELLPLYKINNQDERAVADWTKNWGKHTGVSLRLKNLLIKKKSVKMKSFTVVERTTLNEDDTFLVRLRPKSKVRFQSGDLAGIIPDDGIERLYSIARIDNDLLLSVKKHEFGVCSPFLSTLELDAPMELHIKENTAFHFPKDDKPVILIANGTGIAPFLGMLHENENGNPVHFFLGLRAKKSLELYEEILSEISEKNKLTSLHVAYSREEKNQYVQYLIQENESLISKTLQAGGSIYICGSLAMQNEVLNVLNTISKTHLNKPLSEFEGTEQLKMDCY
ncbi:MAG: sulfite reductase (NADPH) flavoprotein alpha-component [Maribacter sp.]|jgi:sulfite reductase (NADPH) flavoprotein alpha-component